MSQEEDESEFENEPQLVYDPDETAEYTNSRWINRLREEDTRSLKFMVKTIQGIIDDRTDPESTIPVTEARWVMETRRCTTKQIESMVKTIQGVIDERNESEEE